MKPWSQVEADPQFQALPAPEQTKVRQSYLNRAGQDPVFQGMAPEEQQKVRQHILGTPAGPGFAQKALEGAKTAASGMVKGILPYADPRAVARIPIPGAETLNKAVKESAGGVAEGVSESVARAGYPKLATPAGVAASILSGPGAAYIVNPEVKNVGDAAMLYTAGKAVESLPAAGAALADRFPVLKTEIPPARYLYNVAKRKLGLPTETDLVPVDVKAKLASGEMGLADAMRADPDVFAKEAAKRGLNPTATEGTSSTAASAEPAVSPSPQSPISASPAGAALNQSGGPQIPEVSRDVLEKAFSAKTITEHPIFVNAVEKAAPALRESGIDPGDIEAAIAKATEWNDRLHDLKHIAQTQYASMTSEQRVPLEAEVEQLFPKVLATRDMADLYKQEGMLDAVSRKQGLPGQSQAMLEAQIGKPLWSLTPEEFKSRFQLADQRVYDRAVSQAPNRSGQGGYIGTKPGSQPLDPPDVAAYKSRIHNYDPDPVSPVQFGKKIVTELVNKDKALFDLRDLYKGSINPGEDLANLLHTSLGANGIAENNLHLGTWLRHPDGSLTRTGEPLAPTLQAIGNRWQDMDAYLSAQRDPTLAGRGIEGLDAEKADKVATYMEAKYKDFPELANQIRDWTKRSILNPAIQLGVISKEAAAKIEATGDYYTPFRRWSEEWDSYGGGAGGNPIKRMKGSEKDIFSPLQTLLDMNYTSARYFEKVRVGQAILKMKDLSPELSEAIQSVSKAGNDTISVPFEGKTQYLKVSPEIKTAFEALRPAESNAIMNVLGLWAKAQRAGITLDPRFSMYSHNIRYQAEAYMYSKHGFIPGYDFLRGLAVSLGKNEYYDEAMAAGMDRASMVAMDLYNKPKMIAELTRTREMPKNPALYLLQKMRELGDKSVQMGIYMRAREAGADATTAAAQARAAALDFGIRGGSTMVQQINKITPFFNLHLQGLARPIDVLSGKGSAQILASRAQFMTKASALVALTAGLWYLNKDNKDYQELPDWQKILLWNIPAGTRKDGSTRFIPVPKPFIEGIFMMGGTEMLLQHVYKQDPESVQHWAKTTLGTLIPSPVPPFIKTPFEMAANYSFLTGRPIEPQNKSRLLPEDRASDFNSELGKMAAHTAAGRAVGLSPAKFDYAVQGLAGTLGKRALTASDVMMGKKQPTRPDWDILSSRPAIGSNSESVNRFYETFNHLQQQHASANAKIDVHGLSMPESPFLTIMKEADSNMKKLREVNRLISKDPHTDPEKKNALMDKNNAAITEIARNAMSEIEARPDGKVAGDIINLIRAGKTDQAFDAYSAMPIGSRRAFMKQLDVSEAGRAIKGRMLQEFYRRNPGGKQ